MQQENGKPPHINVDYFEDLTGSIPDAPASGAQSIGKRIRTLREDKGLSLAELSGMTGFDVSLLDDIEKSRVQPQLGTVMKLSKALDAAFSRLVSGVGDKLYSITRKEEQKVVSRSTADKGKKAAYVYRSLAPEVQGRHMEALIVQLEESANACMSVHAGEEFIYVLEGVVRLTIGEEIFDLNPGDSAYYLSTTEHLVCAGKGQATILAVLYDN